MQTWVVSLAVATYYYWLRHNEGQENVSFCSAMLEHRITRALHAFDMEGDFNQEMDAVPSVHVDLYTKFRTFDEKKFIRFNPYKHNNPPFSLQQINSDSD